MKYRLEIHRVIVIVLLLSFMALQQCKTIQKVPLEETPKSKVPQISYEADIRPIMLRSCTPCHFPEKGKVKFLDNYAATSNNITDILYRVQLPVDHEKHMPFKSKRPALSNDEIQLFKDWMEQGMPK